MTTALESRLTQAIRPSAIEYSSGGWMDVERRAHRSNQRERLVGRAAIAGFVLALSSGVVLGITVDGGVDTTGLASAPELRDSWPQIADHAAARGQASPGRFWFAGIVGWLPSVLAAMWAWVTAPSHLRTPRPYERRARLSSASAAAALVSTPIAFVLGVWLFLTFDPIAVEAGTSVSAIAFGQASVSMIVFGLGALFATPRVSKTGQPTSVVWNIVVALGVIPFAVSLYGVAVRSLTWRAASDGATSGLWGRLIGWRTYFDALTAEARGLSVLSAWFSFVCIAASMAALAWLSRRIWRVTTLDAVRSRRVATIDLVQVVVVVALIAAPVVVTGPWWVAGRVAVHNLPIPPDAVVESSWTLVVPWEDEPLAVLRLGALDNDDVSTDAIEDALIAGGFDRFSAPDGVEYRRDRSDALDADIVRYGPSGPGVLIDYDVFDRDGAAVGVSLFVAAALVLFAARRLSQRESD